jgi:ATP synthase F1 delta subunit
MADANGPVRSEASGGQEAIVRRIPRDRVVEIWSAIPLTEEEKKALRARWTGRFGDDLYFHFRVDSSLLGGVKVRVGAQIMDGSVAGKLEALREQLLSDGPGRDGRGSWR